MDSGVISLLTLLRGRRLFFGRQRRSRHSILSWMSEDGGAIREASWDLLHSQLVETKRGDDGRSVNFFFPAGLFSPPDPWILA